MTIPVNEQTGEIDQLLEAHGDNLSTNLRVAMPGIITSFDPNTVTCSVQPAIKGAITDITGKVNSVNLPLLADVPVLFPRGGGVTLTFPVREGDECLVVFADRCIDFWWQNGDLQEPVDPRQHDLSDAFALIGPQSQKYKISGISTTATQLRTDSGASFIEIDRGGNVTIDTPLLTVNGKVQINGAVSSTGDQVAAGISQTGHVHGGVQSGGSNTGAAK
ncbi:Gp138 family membrane-puncturing spike protein [Sodalis ligni]|uniref:Phage protein Gp138 N-terminal domain-containing protein n=1 Tax=Sodalis ligni TaxID=2697027 RepID=A0A4R1NA88_9GAMM|nr:Gp138 family membrane-puncturing spike protein [Sodalis ligni]TCL04213.1 hypothetical protein EZJ58_2324 [Sodalis ligni]